jgi:hypothetical protein
MADNALVRGPSLSTSGADGSPVGAESTAPAGPKEARTASGASASGSERQVRASFETP